MNIRRASPRQQRGLVVLLALVLAWAWNGFLIAAPPGKKPARIGVGVFGRVEREGLYLIDGRLGLAGLLELAGAETGALAAAPESTLAPGSRIDVGDDGVTVGRLGEGQRFLLGLSMDINRAEADDLALIDGIGPKRARAIVALRERLGRIQNMDQLLEAPGVGPKALERLKAAARVE